MLREDACLDYLYKNLYRKADLDLLSPSRHDGLSMEEENCLRRSYCQLLLEAGKRLRMWVPHIRDDALFVKVVPEEKGLQSTHR